MDSPFSWNLPLIIGVDLAKLHSAVKLWGFGAGKGVHGMVAGQGGLVKDGGVAADETPLVVFNNFAGIILNWLTNVEDLHNKIVIKTVMGCNWRMICQIAK